MTGFRLGYRPGVSVVSRGKGQSMVAKAAYNSRDAIREERTGEMKDYSRKPDKPLASFLYSNNPELTDPGTLWNFYDALETRSNAQLGYSLIAALPYELSDRQRGFMVKDFMREEFLRQGVAAQVDLHAPDETGDERNYHVHILASMRKVGKDGLGEKVFTWEEKEKTLARWREKWAECGAKELEKAGYKVEAERWRYGHLTNEQQKKKALERGDRAWADIKAQQPGIKLGPKASAMQRKGKPTDRGDISRRIKNVNAMQAERDAKDRSIADEEEKLSEPPRSPQDERERSAAVTAAGDRAMRVKTKRPDPLKWDGFQPWQRPAPVPAAVRPARPQRVGD